MAERKHYPVMNGKRVFKRNDERTAQSPVQSAMLGGWRGTSVVEGGPQDSGVPPFRTRTLRDHGEEPAEQVAVRGRRGEQRRRRKDRVRRCDRRRGGAERGEGRASVHTVPKITDGRVVVPQPLGPWGLAMGQDPGYDQAERPGGCHFLPPGQRPGLERPGVQRRELEVRQLLKIPFARCALGNIDSADPDGRHG
jgi:hypothetical protein